MYKKRYRRGRGNYNSQSNHPDIHQDNHRDNHRDSSSRSFLHKISTLRYQASTKGQITVFIILGLLLLLVLILVISLQKEIITVKPGELIPTTKGRVESLISSCMTKVGEDAIIKLGFQGGYIDVPHSISSDASQHLRISPFQVVPYWAYGSDTFIPSLSEIKNRIDLYMMENLHSCVFDLEPFKDTYDIIEKSGITSDTEIVASRVIFNVEWILEVNDKAGETISELKEHVADSPIKLKKTYEAAVNILEREMVELKLEDITQDLIALEHPDLPVAGLEMSCDRKTWSVKKARETLQDMLRVNLKKLKVEGTEFVEFPDEFPYYQNHYVWNIDGVDDEFSASEVSAIFRYDNTFPMTFQVTPTQGGRMISSSSGGSGADLLTVICIQNWKFTYDVVYPVLLQMKDETTGYTFQIAFTVHLIRNIPNRKTEVLPRADGNMPTQTSDDYCESGTIPMSILAWEVVENNQGVSMVEPLEGANITFTCIKYRCDLGQTSFNYAFSGYQAGLIDNVPYCVGGIVRGQKESYKEDWARVIPTDHEPVELKMVPLLQFPVSGIKVIKHNFDVEKGILSPGRELSGKELALIRMAHYKAGTQGIGDGRSGAEGEAGGAGGTGEINEGTLAGQQIVNGRIKFHDIQQPIGSILDKQLSERLNIDLLAKADFEYEVDVTLFDDDELIGGYKGKWTIPWGDLESAGEMVFHVLERRGSDEEIIDLLLNMETYSAALEVAPELK